jgi:hypothetical protein
MTSLETIHGTLVRRISRVDRYLLEDASKSKFEAILHRSAAVSHLWQAWALHNRDFLTGCLAGNLLVDGTPLVSPISGLSEEEQLYCAQQYSEGNVPKAGGKIKSHLSEPNWGDISKVIEICSRANFELSQYFSSCFGLGVRLRDLQLCRNTCAHISKGQLIDFNRSRVRYNNNSFLHPSDMLNWVDPSTGQSVWASWTGEMITISELILNCK